MAKASMSHMNTHLPLPNRSSSFLQFKHFTPCLSFPNPNQNPNQNQKPLRLSTPNCTVPPSVAASDSPLTVTRKAADVYPELKGTSIFLLGMKSSLKISLGNRLAEALRYYYFDSDSLVEEAAGGASAAKSFRESDEKGLSECETEVLKQLSSMGRLVVCVGNGAVQSSTNLALLRHGISLWIDVPLDIVARDVIEDRNQYASLEISVSGSYPEVKDELGVLYDKYRDGYATADATISVQKLASRLGCDNLDEITGEDMTLEALKEIEKLTRVKKMMEDAARPF
ncbi:hypothetical protein VNO77_34061 [Canavalia gladiata]|uniref:Inactive shikimate kinase like 1, chloroplastic n=1 Tax=Canavalia gladiata TaxID=3824 RepID=A0AAN9KEZ2_CANGL